MREKLYRFMAGRYGTDQLNRFLSILALVLVIANLFAKTPILWLLAVVLLVFVYIRMFSRKLEARRAENQRFLQLTGRVTGAFRGLKDRWTMRKDYVFFHCPSCRALLRVPRGKGKIRVTCRKCGSAFERKT